MQNHILNYSLDLIAFAAIALTATWIVSRWLSRAGGGKGIGLRAWGLLGVLLLVGCFLARQAGENARAELRQSLEGFAPTYALELARFDHARITPETAAEDPAYLKLIELEKQWLQVNPAVNDIYTFRINAAGDYYFVVDSETDYNHSGTYDEEREQRTAIGEKYKDAPPSFQDAMAGRGGFDGEPYVDRWGTWISATAPIYGPDGKVEAAVGVDFDAHHWVRTILLRRAGVLAFCGVALTILIWSGGIIALARHEISLRRAAEASSRQAGAQLQMIVDHEPEGVIVCATNGQILRINPSGLQLLEMTAASEAGGREFGSYVVEDERPAFDAWRSSVLAGEAGKITAKLVGRHGGEKYFEAHGVPLRDGDGSIRTMLMVVRDITASRAAEIEREHLQQQLVTASRQAGMAEIATGVLHNVGNVLNTVNISTHVLTDKLRQSKVQNLSRASELLMGQRENLPQFFTADERGKTFPAYLGKLAGVLRAEHEEMLGTIRSISEGIDHIKAIVASQQSFATHVNVDELLRPAAVFEEALKLNIVSCERHHVNVEKIFDEIPPIMLEKHKILQILINLIGNAKDAIKASSPGTGVITLRLRRGEMEGAGSVRFEVSDNGMGIAPENLSRIFGMGFTTRKDGHGFGLHSSANYAKEMGGRISASSEGPGRGATFILELPKLQAKAAA